MFGIFKKSDKKPINDVKVCRQHVLQFVKEELQKLEGGEGAGVKKLCLYIDPGAEELHILEAAVHLHQPDKLKAEIQRCVDDYAIELPQDWSLEVDVATELAPRVKKISDLDLWFLIVTKDTDRTIHRNALLRVLSGEANSSEYSLKAGSEKVSIGRGQQVQMDDGFFRINQVAFSEDSEDSANRYISRQHAHIEWDQDRVGFFLFADEGGLPPWNKVKVKSAITGEQIRLHSMEIGHRLEDGDQIIIGEKAVLEFRFIS